MHVMLEWIENNLAPLRLARWFSINTKLGTWENKSRSDVENKSLRKLLLTYSGSIS